MKGVDDLQSRAVQESQRPCQGAKLRWGPYHYRGRGPCGSLLWLRRWNILSLLTGVADHLLRQPPNCHGGPSEDLGLMGADDL